MVGGPTAQARPTTMITTQCTPCFALLCHDRGTGTVIVRLADRLLHFR